MPEKKPVYLYNTCIVHVSNRLYISVYVHYIIVRVEFFVCIYIATYNHPITKRYDMRQEQQYIWRIIHIYMETYISIRDNINTNHYCVIY